MPAERDERAKAEVLITPAFLDKVAHDIRGPSGVTLGALDELTLALGPELAEKHGPLLAMARRGAQKVLKVADFLGETAEGNRERETERSTPSTGSATEKAPTGERLRVLVVDDDEDAVDLLALTLGQAGFEPLVARNLAEAKEVMATQSPCGLVTDLKLPDGPGLDTMGFAGAEKLRARFVLSGHDDPARKRQSLDRGFQEHLVKPVDSMRLVALLNRYLGQA